MDTEQYFRLIDQEIASFNADGRFIISSDTHSDWLKFNTRKIAWVMEGINFSIQIFPNFNDAENIISWTLYAVAWFDKENERYLQQKAFADKVQLNEIAANMKELLNNAYEYINSFRRFDLTKVVE
ncbi:MAG TPA: hypothetical protein VGM63_24230 [Mucilaginibacter sp.]|jgi:hypothetical protein